MSRNTGGTGSVGNHSCGSPSSIAEHQAQRLRRRIDRIDVGAAVAQVHGAARLDIKVPVRMFTGPEIGGLRRAN